MKSIVCAIMGGASIFSAAYLMAHAPEQTGAIGLLYLFAAGCVIAVERAKE